MTKAKSRLNLSQAVVSSVVAGSTTTSTVGTTSTQTSTRQPQSFSTRSRYLEKIGSLIVAIFFFILLLLVLWKFSPAELENFLIPGSYLPFFILLFLSNFFWWSYVFLNSALGFFGAIFICALVFLRVQQVVF